VREISFFRVDFVPDYFLLFVYSSESWIFLRSEDINIELLNISYSRKFSLVRALTSYEQVSFHPVKGLDVPDGK
jgi:hypothetical protein